MAGSLLGGAGGPARTGELPDWARPRSGPADGSSGSLLYALADLDLLTPGSLVGDLRVAATGSIFSDGAIAPVRLLDAKLAAARLAGANVFFAPAPPTGAIGVTELVSPVGLASPDRPIGAWLHTSGHEAAGRAAASHPGTLAVVVVHDVRQALSWLCGRTGGPTVCAIAHAASAVPIGAVRAVTGVGPAQLAALGNAA